MISRIIGNEISGQTDAGYYNIGTDTKFSNLFILFPYTIAEKYPDLILGTIGPTMLVEWTDE